MWHFLRGDTMKTKLLIALILLTLPAQAQYIRQEKTILLDTNNKLIYRCYQAEYKKRTWSYMKVKDIQPWGSDHYLGEFTNLEECLKSLDKIEEKLGL